jgi:hypothetical protein
MSAAGNLPLADYRFARPLTQMILRGGQLAPLGTRCSNGNICNRSNNTPSTGG